LYAGDLAIAVLTLAILLCLFRMKNLNIPLRRLMYFLIWNLLIEVAARLFIIKGINNLPLLHVYTVGEFILFSWFYKSLISKPGWFRNKFWVIVSGVTIFMIANSLIFHLGGDYNSTSKTVAQVIIISYAVLYFYNLTNIQTISKNDSKGLSLVNSAVLIYYSGSLFIFMFSQAIREYPEWIKTFWAFNAVLNLFFQLLVFFGIWKVVYKKTPSSL
jgi:hypothetical protein